EHPMTEHAAGTRKTPKKKAGSSATLDRRTSAMIAAAVGAVAVGAFAIGVLAIGRLKIRRLAIERAKIKRLEIDELAVKRLRVSDSLSVPENEQGRKFVS